MIEFPLRPRVDLNTGWEFVRGKVGRRWLKGGGTAGQPVKLPHCWNLDDTYQFGRKSYRGFGAYRREIRVPTLETGGTWYLVAGGFYGIGDVWLDGRRLDRVDGQYLGFVLPLPTSLDEGSHVIAIRLDNRAHRNVLPGKKDPDFLLYGGLTGGVRIERRPWPRLDARSTVIACGPKPDGSELVKARSFVGDPHGTSADVRLQWTITDQGGKPVAQTEHIPAAEMSEAAVVVGDPRCWSPEHPDLYWAEGRMENDSGVIDVVRVRFGITRAEFRPREGFFLAGERVDLHGVNRHESIPGLGSALPSEIHRSDAQLLKKYGCNLVRLSHYPQHPAFLDACDELGIMVYAELASWKSVRSSRGWRRAARRQFHDLITRDRHHPSVILWGMGNESRSRKAYLELRDAARELDPARPVTYAENHLHRARRKKTTGIPDVWSTNYEFDILDAARDSSRLEVVFLSECCNHPASIKGEQQGELEQIRVIEAEWAKMAKIEGLAGYAVWSFADYATEHRDRFRRQNGLFDAWRRPKMAAELFRARYGTEPFISLHATRSRRGRELHVFTNCGELRVIRAGRPTIDLDDGWHHVLPYDEDWTDLRIEGSHDGTTVNHDHRTAGTAAAIGIAIDEDEIVPGRLVAVDLDIRDARNLPADDWNGHVEVAVDGDARLLPYTPAAEGLMARGEGRVYLEIGESGEPIVITASADGLETASRTVTPLW